MRSYVLNPNTYRRLVNRGKKMVCSYPPCNEPIKPGQTVMSRRGHRNNKTSKLYHQECWIKAHV